MSSQRTRQSPPCAWRFHVARVVARPFIVVLSVCWLQHAAAAANTTPTPRRAGGATCPARQPRAELAPAPPDAAWTETTWATLPIALRRGPAFVFVHSSSGFSGARLLRRKLRLARHKLRGFVGFFGIDAEAHPPDETRLAGWMGLIGLAAGQAVERGAVLFHPASPRKRFLLYRGALEPGAMAEFAISQLHSGALHVNSSNGLRALLRQRVPTSVLCLSSVDPEALAPRRARSRQRLVDEFVSSAETMHLHGRPLLARQAHEAPRTAAFAFVTDFGRGEPGACDAPRLSFVFTNGEERTLSGRAFFAEYSRPDWIREASGAELPEMTVDNREGFEDEGGFLFAALFDHTSAERRRAIVAALRPLVLEHGVGGNVRVVSVDGAKYAHQFGLRREEEAAIVLDNTEQGRAGQVEPEIHVGRLDEPPILQRLGSRMRSITHGPLEAHSSHLRVLRDVVTDLEAAQLRDAFPEVPKDEIDSVDGYPTFDYALPRLMQDCTKRSSALGRVPQHVCELEQAVAAKVRPFVLQALNDWGLSDGRDLKLCSSFVRRYIRHERRWIGPHPDDSVITVNILLNDPADYVGGLMVFPPDLRGHVIYPERERNAAVMHRGDVEHAVDIRRGWRYSWIMFWDFVCSEP